ncbi:MAG TPA: hypothetical protein VF193_06945 [Steroidobacter sp.]
MHYVIRAQITPDGVLNADVRIDLPRSGSGKWGLVLSRRFVLQPVETTPQAEVGIQPTEEPLGRLNRIDVRLKEPGDPPTVRVRYRGPVFASEEQDRLGYTPDCIEMALELMWLPFASQLNERFTVDAEIAGVPADMVVVAQGEVEHEGDVVRVRRQVPDFDFAWTAVRGLERVSAPGIDFYARDHDDPLVKVLRKHALDSAQFHQKWFGPMPGGTIRLAVVPRKNGGAYARIGYTIIPEGRAAGEPPVEFSETGRAASVAHEFAHAWWAPADPLSEDYWLAESIAQYASWRYIESVFGREFLESRLGPARAGIANAGPVLGHGRPSRLVLYTKVPLMLIDLERRIGRDKLDRVLATLGRRPPRKTQEFLEVLREVAGEEVARDFEASLREG